MNRKSGNQKRLICALYYHLDQQVFFCLVIGVVVSFVAVIRVVTQCSSPSKQPLVGEERYVTTLITAAKETIGVVDVLNFFCCCMYVLYEHCC